MPHYDFTGNKPNHMDLIPWGCPGHRFDNHKSDDFDLRSMMYLFLGHSNTTKVMLTYEPKSKKIIRAFHFKADNHFASNPNHSLLLGIKNPLSPVPIQQLPEVKLEVMPDQFSLLEATDQIKIKLSLPSSNDAPLNVTIKDNDYFNIPMLKATTSRRPW